MSRLHEEVPCGMLESYEMIPKAPMYQNNDKFFEISFSLRFFSEYTIGLLRNLKQSTV